MPRDGTGASDNAVENTNNIIHGASGDTSLNRASKVAPLPEAEKGAALEGLNASGGGSAGTNQGKGNDSNKEPLVDQVTK